MSVLWRLIEEWVQHIHLSKSNLSTYPSTVSKHLPKPVLKPPIHVVSLRYSTTPSPVHSSTQTLQFHTKSFYRSRASLLPGVQESVYRFTTPPSFPTVQPVQEMIRKQNKHRGHRTNSVGLWHPNGWSASAGDTRIIICIENEYPPRVCHCGFYKTIFSGSTETASVSLFGSRHDDGKSTSQLVIQHKNVVFQKLSIMLCHVPNHSYPLFCYKQQIKR